MSLRAPFNTQAWLPLVAMRGYSLDLLPGAGGAAGAATPHISVSDFSNGMHLQIVPLGSGRVRLVGLQVSHSALALCNARLSQADRGLPVWLA